MCRGLFKLGDVKGLTSLFVETTMQEPVTVSPTTEDEPIAQDTLYLMSSLRVTGAKVTSRGISMPGRIKPLAGVMVKPRGNLSVFQQKLYKKQTDRKQQIKKQQRKHHKCLYVQHALMCISMVLQWWRALLDSELNQSISSTSAFKSVLQKQPRVVLLFDYVQGNIYLCVIILVCVCETKWLGAHHLTFY